MVNFATALVILALCGGAGHAADSAKTAKADGGHCGMHASAKAEGKNCCASHGREAKADGAACNHEAKSADKASCCASHGKAAAKGEKPHAMKGAAAHQHGAGKSCNHGSKATEARMDAKSTVKAAPAATAAYACPMHPEVTSDKPADCSKCGMNLEKKG